MSTLRTLLCHHPAVIHFFPSPASDTLHGSYLPPPLFSSGVWSLGDTDKRSNARHICLRCNATSKHHAQVYTEITKQNRTLSKWLEFTKQDFGKRGVPTVRDVDKLSEWIETIKKMMRSMEDGEISISAYDTSWVAQVENIHGHGGPQFPSSLQWIIDNQLEDGSWGDELIFTAYDRILNTLGCVVALKTWNIHPKICEKGLLFIQQNMNKLENEKAEHMPIGFEVVFPSLIEIARKLDLEIPYDSPSLRDIYAQRNLKLTKIPMHMLHIVPTTLLHSLEGMEGLDWEKLIKLQSSGGSFLFSPASTASALMNTKDEKCLEYLEKYVGRFNGGVPNVYPVDLFEHLWVVDRLERLGISRYFQNEIKECVHYVSRYWTEDGIAWARNSNVRDIDDTAMGFRLLRLHGHDVSPDVFRHFEKGGEFFCFVGQSNQDVTGMFNLYRASQVSFPGENILNEAKTFACKNLQEKKASNQLLDKWIITKDLSGEVVYALDIPWYASLPRIETRVYLEQYGGKDDIWIGKTLYRMNNVNNDTYLKLAKLDFNNCQALHQIEWQNMQKWYSDCNLVEFGVTSTTLLETFFIAVASIFEPERSPQRLAWIKTALLVEAVLSYLKDSSKEQRMEFIHDFNNKSSVISNGYHHSSRNWNWSWKIRNNERTNKLVNSLLGTFNNIAMEGLAENGSDMHKNLHKTVGKWMLVWQEENDNTGEAELLVDMINHCGGLLVSQELLSHPQYKHLINLTNRICYQLDRTHKATKVKINGPRINGAATTSIDTDMQELVQTVLRSADGVDSKIKHTFLTVAKSFFYKAHCSQETMDRHIAQVLFKSVY